MASFEAHVDKTSMILLGGKNRGPCPRFVDQNISPGSANMCQSQNGAYVLSNARRYEELEYFKEDIVGGATAWGRA